jgi:hypothetical protein
MVTTLTLSIHASRSTRVRMFPLMGELPSDERSDCSFRVIERFRC